MKTLSIESSWASLDISTRQARLQISNNMARRLKITVIRPQMVVDRKAASFRLDWSSRVRRLNNLLQLKHYLQQKNKNKLLDVLNRSLKHSFAMEGLSGDYMLSQPQSAVQMDASQTVSVSQGQEVASASVPKLEWDPGYFKVDWIAGEIKIEWEENSKPDIQVSPYSVEIRVKGKKMVKIALNEEKLPYLKGRKVNKGV